MSDYGLVENICITSDSGDKMASYNQRENEVLQNKTAEKVGGALVMPPAYPQKEVMHARCLTERKEYEQLSLINERQYMHEENLRNMDILSNEDLVDRASLLKLEIQSKETSHLENQKQALVMGSSKDITMVALQNKLDKVTKQLEKARLLNCQYQEDQASQLSQKRQFELVCEQVEMETAKTILHLQEEVAALRLDLEEKLCCATEENMRLRDMVAAKEDKIRTLCLEWERATLELTSFLVEGSKSLRDASGQIESIACSFPHVNVWLGEHVERAARICVEKEETILKLQRSLEDAQKMVWEMEQNLDSLKGATAALTGVQRQENDTNTRKTAHLTFPLYSKINKINMFENKLMYLEDQITEAENNANAKLPEEKRLSDCAESSLKNYIEGDISVSNLGISFGVGSQQLSEMNTCGNSMALQDIGSQVDLARVVLMESGNAISTSYTSAEQYLSTLQSDIDEASSLYMELIKSFLENIREMRKIFMELKYNCGNCSFQAVELPPMEVHKISENENCHFLLHQIGDELTEINDRLNKLSACIDKKLNRRDWLGRPEDQGDIDKRAADCSTSGSDLSAECVATQKSLDGFASTCCYCCSGEITAQTLELEFEGCLVYSADDQTDKLEGLVHSSFLDETTIFHLRKEVKKANESFSKLNLLFAALFHEKGIEDCSYASAHVKEVLGFVNSSKQYLLRSRRNESNSLELSSVLKPSELIKGEAAAGDNKTREFITNEKFNQASNFLTRFEEAHATIKEADVMVNALMKANENAKQLTGIWKKAGEELMMEKASLIKEIKHLKSLLHLKDGENEMLQDQMHYNLRETATSLSLLEMSFQHMQRNVEEKFRVIYSDALAMAQDVWKCFCNSRSSLEEFSSEIMEQGFASLVLYQCYFEKLLHNFPSLTVDPGFHQTRLQEGCLILSNPVSKNDTVVKGGERVDQSASLEYANLMDENLLLKNEVERKDVLLKGLLFDFSLLQESASTIMDMKEALNQVQQELHLKTNKLHHVLVERTKLEADLADTETALLNSNSELEQAKGTIHMLSDDIAELRVLLNDLYLRKSEVDEQLEEQREVVRSFENEILRMNSSTDKKLLSSVEDIEDDLSRFTVERDQLQEQVGFLQDRLDMANKLADENEAIAIESRQESEASKIYAEQKEEEVKILERSVQELECTINVLEKKVYEMETEIEKHRLIRDSLELELQALKKRMVTVENFTETTGSELSNGEEQPEDQLSRSLALHEAHKRIRLLEEEREEQDRQVKQCKEYISELVLHAEAQASQYQQKYKTLEAMVREVKNESTSTSAAMALDKTEKSSMRPRGSSSPFRCISNLVQQMNLEKDQELSVARLRIEELEALVASRQKEVCTLNARIAAAESMTHDVIRDLLGVKLDMTNYANLIDQYQLQKVVEDAQLQVQQSVAMEQEILNLRRQINDLLEERDRCISEVHRRQADTLVAQVTVEQLQERDQLLTAQNEMLKVDNGNLKRRVVELDDMIKKLFGTQNAPLRIQQQMKMKENSLSKQLDDADLRRLRKSEKLLSQVHDELSRFRNSDGRDTHDKFDVVDGKPRK